MKYANTLETMLAKQDIADCLARYARGVDRADGELLHSCYFDDRRIVPPGGRRCSQERDLGIRAGLLRHGWYDDDACRSSKHSCMKWPKWLPY